MGRGGGGFRRLTRTVGDDTAGGWSPDGSAIVYTSGREGAGDLKVVAVDGAPTRWISRDRFGGSSATWR